MSALILTTRYEKQKAALSTALKDSVGAWVRIASILREIKTQETWREEFKTWNDFIEKCQGFHRRQANALIHDLESHEMLESLFVKVGIAMPTLTQENTKILGQISEPDVQKEALDEATEGGAKPPTRKALASAVVKRLTQPEKRANAKVLDSITGKPEQQEFSFTITAAPEHREDAEWFSKLAETDRANIIAAARRAME